MAVALEMARTIIADPSFSLAAPVVFLFNGGEETLSQAANGFMSSSRWVPLLPGTTTTGYWHPHWHAASF